MTNPDLIEFSSKLINQDNVKDTYYYFIVSMLIIKYVVLIH